MRLFLQLKLDGDGEFRVHWLTACGARCPARSDLLNGTQCCYIALRLVVNTFHLEIFFVQLHEMS